ncbi:unnamed protein product [Moneuplotes crassus]|uniref:Uncharacterized protein n=1 Tax=Euplotes crassus TaxID=5936 RepID=A0AAD1UU10_EUPCR|nr:unnamed protein product [Moneuplotes crassus]
MDFGKRTPGSISMRSLQGHSKDLSTLEPSELVSKVEMLEKDLSFQKEQYERKIKRKDDKIAELLKEIDYHKRIRAETKTELVHKVNEIDELEKEKNQVHQSMKEADNKSENLKLMLVASKNAMKKCLVVFGNIKSYISMLKEDEKELLESVRERYQKKSLDQNCSLFNSRADQDHSMDAHSFKSAPVDVSNFCKDIPDGSEFIPSKDKENPESLFLDYIMENQMKHIDSLGEVMEDVDDKVEILEKEVEKISKLDAQRLMETPLPVNFDELLYKHPNEEGQKERDYQSKMCKLISLEIQKVSKTIETIKKYILEERFSELKELILSHDANKGRLSETFTPTRNDVENKENAGMYTQMKDHKKYRVLKTPLHL